MLKILTMYKRVFHLQRTTENQGLIYEKYAKTDSLGIGIHKLPSMVVTLTVSLSICNRKWKKDACQTHRSATQD